MLWDFSMRDIDLHKLCFKGIACGYWNTEPPAHPQVQAAPTTTQEVHYPFLLTASPTFLNEISSAAGGNGNNRPSTVPPCPVLFLVGAFNQPWTVSDVSSIIPDVDNKWNNQAAALPSKSKHLAVSELLTSNTWPGGDPSKQAAPFSFKASSSSTKDLWKDLPGLCRSG